MVVCASSHLYLYRVLADNSQSSICIRITCELKVEMCDRLLLADSIIGGYPDGDTLGSCMHIIVLASY